MFFSTGKWSLSAMRIILALMTIAATVPLAVQAHAAG
jgi:hypothetical protein